MLTWIDRLPSDSAFAQAQSQDDELAARLLEREESEPDTETRPPVTEWSPEVRMLAGVVSRLDQLIVTLIEANGGKTSKLNPIRGPETALERAERAAQMRNYESLLAAVERSPSRRASNN